MHAVGAYTCVCGDSVCVCMRIYFGMIACELSVENDLVAEVSSMRMMTHLLSVAGCSDGAGGLSCHWLC